MHSAGTFASDTAGFNDLRFPGLYGKLQWNEHAFDVWNAGSKFYGGDAKFKYSIKPFGSPHPTTQRFEVTLAHSDLAAFTDFGLPKGGLHFAGSADAHVYLEWLSRNFNQRIGRGHISVDPPPGVTLMTASLDTARAVDANHTHHEWGPFAPQPLPGQQPRTSVSVHTVSKTPTPQPLTQKRALQTVELGVRVPRRLQTDVPAWGV